jgi:hypothetical protein
MGPLLGKVPTTPVRRLISPLIGLVECRLARCWAGKVMKARTSALQPRPRPGKRRVGRLGTQLIGDLAPLGAPPAASPWAKAAAGGGDDAAVLPASKSQDIAHEVHVASMPGEVLSTYGLPSRASGRTSLTPRKPRRASLPVLANLDVNWRRSTDRANRPRSAGGGTHLLVSSISGRIG